MNVRNAPPEIVPLYACPVCGTVYDSHSEAEVCRNQMDQEPGVAPGDIVLVNLRYHWIDGDPLWVAKKHPNGEHVFYAVVTAVTPRHVSPQLNRCFGHKSDHSWLLHVHTLALHNGSPDGFHGWTSKDHVPVQRALDCPSEVREQGQKFVGNVYNNLL